MLRIPFSVGEFFAVFAAYNEAVWPAQLVLLAAALAAVAAALLRSTNAGRWAAGILGALWIWSGAAYHILHFARINPAAIAFGSLFILQGILFVAWGTVGGRLSFMRQRGPRRAVGWLVVAYALVIYPLWTALTGHPWMASPTFGAPCPTVIFTFGLLLLAASAPWWLVVIPVAWAVVGSSAALTLGVPQDAGLLVGALLYLGFELNLRRQAARRTRHDPVPPASARPA